MMVCGPATGAPAAFTDATAGAAFVVGTAIAAVAETMFVSVLGAASVIVVATVVISSNADEGACVAAVAASALSLLVTASAEEVVGASGAGATVNGVMEVGLAEVSSSCVVSLIMVVTAVPVRSGQFCVPRGQVGSRGHHGPAGVSFPRT